jgi:hypothetical protein
VKIDVLNKHLKNEADAECAKIAKEKRKVKG